MLGWPSRTVGVLLGSDIFLNCLNGVIHELLPPFSIDLPANSSPGCQFAFRARAGQYGALAEFRLLQIQLPRPLGQVFGIARLNRRAEARTRAECDRQ